MLRVVTQGGTTKVDVVEYSCSKGAIASNTIGGITASNKNIRLGEYETPNRAKEVFLAMVKSEALDLIFYMPDKIEKLDTGNPNRYHGKKTKGYGES